MTLTGSDTTAGEGRIDESAAPRADDRVDAVGLFCPLPIMRTAERIRELHVGRVLELRADDPVTLIDMPNWCKGQGHRYLGWTRSGDELRLFIQVGEAHTTTEARPTTSSPGKTNGS